MRRKEDFAGVHHGLGGLPAGGHAFGFAETRVSAFAPVRRRRQRRLRAHRNLELTSPFFKGSCWFLTPPRGHSSSNTFTRAEGGSGRQKAEGGKEKAGGDPLEPGLVVIRRQAHHFDSSTAIG